MTNYLQQKMLFMPQVRARTAPNLGLCLVIPVYDEPFLLRTLMNLQKCELPSYAVEVIVVVNNGDHASQTIIQKNRRVYLQALEWAKQNLKPLLRFHILYHDDLPKPFANADLARKIGMDEAVFRLEKSRKKRGIIALLDADARVEKNYFKAIEAYFKKRKRSDVVMTDFSFPTFGIDYEDGVYEAASQHELHLRYCLYAFQTAGIPFDYKQMPGSVATNLAAYQKAGGWPSAVGRSHLLKKAHLLKSTVIEASPRLSKRNLSGTGVQIQSIVKNKGICNTYSPVAIDILGKFLKKYGKQHELNIKEMKDCPVCLSDYFSKIELQDCQLNEETFTDYFVDKHLQAYLDFAHLAHYTKLPVIDATKALLLSTSPDIDVKHSSLEELLGFLKKNMPTFAPCQNQ